MAWQMPSLQELITQVQRAFAVEMPVADASLARNNLAPVAKVLAGGFFDLHRFAAWAVDQKFIATCDDELLDRHGAEMKPPLPRKQAATASGAITVTAYTAGSVATGAILTRIDGTQFVVQGGVVLGVGGSADIAVVATSPGAAGNTAASSVLSAVSGVTGNLTFSVNGYGLSGGADIESDSAYRTRLLQAKAHPDHGGSAADWQRYALSFPGVTRAFIDPLAAGRGTVVIYPLYDLTRPNGIGSDIDRQQLSDYLMQVGAGAAWPVVRMPVAYPVNITVTGLSPYSPEVISAVQAEIAATFMRQGRVAGLSDYHPSMPFLAIPTAFSRSWIWQAVANASGEAQHSITLPVADFALAEGEIAVPGDVNFN